MAKGFTESRLTESVCVCVFSEPCTITVADLIIISKWIIFIDFLALPSDVSPSPRTFFVFASIRKYTTHSCALHCMHILVMCFFFCFVSASL